MEYEIEDSILFAIPTGPEQEDLLIVGETMVCLDTPDDRTNIPEHDPDQQGIWIPEECRAEPEADLRALFEPVD